MPEDHLEDLGDAVGVEARPLHQHPDAAAQLQHVLQVVDTEIAEAVPAPVHRRGPLTPRPA